MSQKWDYRLAWAFALLILLMGLLAGGIAFSGRAWIPAADRAALAITFILFPIYLAVGLVILRFRPGNRIGWLFLAVAFIFILATLMREYAIYGYFYRHKIGGWPGVRLAAWVSININASFFLWIILLNLLFPDGRLASPGFRWLVWLTLFASGALILQEFVRPGYMILYRSSSSITLPFTNPTGIAWLYQLFSNIEGVAWSLNLLCLLASGLAPLQRYRSGQGVERQQIKWLAYFWFLVFSTITIMILAQAFSVSIPEPVSEMVFSALTVGLIAGFPVIVMLALLRYRLYDIDLIIRRTLIYGALTAALALVYAGGVVSLQQVFQLFTGSTGQSQPAIVFSTLAVAALFNPLRKRLQGRIDRRFYRRKYDAERILAAFTEKARQETDLDALTGQLLAAVQTSLQPEKASLWLKESNKETVG
jgi:hypothetical protein